MTRMPNVTIITTAPSLTPRGAFLAAAFKGLLAQERTCTITRVRIDAETAADV